MFLIRTAFWLTIIVAFIPVNPADLKEGQRPVSTMEALGAAQAVVRDLSSFCMRNGEACETGREVFAQLGAKARTGLGYVTAYLEETPAETEADTEVSTAATGQEAPAASDSIRTGAIE